MSLALAPAWACAERDKVATPVAVGLVVVETRRAVQGLVDVAHEVQESDEIVLDSH